MLTREEALRYLRDPALKGRWRVAIGEPAAQVAVENITVTFAKVGSANRFYQGMTYDFPSFSSTDAVALTLYESDDFRVTRWLAEWSLKVFNPATGIYGRPPQYMRDVRVLLFPIDSDSQPTLTVVLDHCWPSDRQPWDLSYDAPDGRVVVQTQLAVRSMRVEFPQP